MSHSAENRPRIVPPNVSLGDSGDEFEGTARFEIVRKIGAGGMGVVYEAYDREREARVALKTLRTLKPDALLRFKNEFRSLQDIHHPNLVTLGELFEEEGRWFFTMEMVDGEHFLDYVQHTEEPDPSISVVSADEPWPASLPGESTDQGPPSPDAPTVDVPGEGGRTSHVAPRSKHGLLSSGADERRLRSTLAQLALGLAALHRAQKVHRDIKPSNILVTSDGVVKLLDFGLIADLRTAETESHLVGTFSYMAPEQAGLRQVGPAADWYSVGVLIYKAITGRLPVTGGAREVLVLKQAFEPAPPSAIANVPEDLDILCVELLRIDPTARPSERAILERLDARDAAMQGGGQLTHFIGRRMELAALGKAFAMSRKTRGVTFFVHGESGVGKSALVRRFTEGAGHDAPGTVIFVGRCYERENVPFKGGDGSVDALSRYLAGLDPNELAVVLPRQIGIVGQVFPVMRRIDAIAQAPKPAPGALDPQILRARLFFALRELLLRLSLRAPIVLVIDDLQWADADSLALLAEVMRPPDAPKLLLLATMRHTHASEGAAPGRRVADVAAMFSGDVRQIEIQSLPRDEAQALVAALLYEAGEGKGIDVAQIAEAASGHPLFIDELVRRRLTAGVDAGPLKLDEALWARVEMLEHGARAMLEIIAVAGVPIAQETAALAAKIDLAELVRRVGVLRGGNLVRTAGVRRSDTVEPYHDRVREAVLLHIGDDTRSRCHARLALALEASERADPEALATHWQGAGDVDKALVYALRAATQAEEALAFDRAARLYKLSLALRAQVGAGADEADVSAKLGDALANAGRGAEAAEAYLAAVDKAPPTTSADAILDLRRKATEQLLRSGRIDEGIAELGVVLSTIDVELPKTPARAAIALGAALDEGRADLLRDASLLVRRAQVRLRGVGFRARRAAEISADLLQRVDICWSASIVLGMVDNLRGADFQARGLLLALDAGEPFRAARALAAEACFASAEGGPGKKRAETLLDAALASATKADHPFVLAWCALSDGVVAYCLGEFKRSYDSCVRAKEMFTNRCTGVAWERETADLYTILSAFYLGRIKEQGRRVDEGARHADERDDLFASTYVRSGLATMAWIARDEPDRGRAEVARTAERWSRRGYFFAHFWCFIANAQIDLYVGDPRRSLDRIRAEWPLLSQSLLLRSVQIMRVESLHARARAAIALGETIEEGRADLLRDASDDADRLAGEHIAYATPLAALLRAGIAAVRGQRAPAAAELTAAIQGFEKADMRTYAMAACFRRAELLGDSGELAAVAGWMREEEIRSPHRFVAMLAPGFSRIRG